MAKAIMIQGTMSGARKSLLCAALCRIFRQDGLGVAPFKSLNMALNSFITQDGLEMGRAQVTQAQAAGIEPDARMNPILLKPCSDTGSQVIVNGEVRGRMSAAEYFRYKTQLIPDILAAYHRPALAKLGREVHCYMAEERVADMAGAEGVTRAAASMRIAAREHPGAVFAVGNAPTALLELCALMQGLRPALVIGVPVGFVNVAESKKFLLAVCGQYGVPAIIAMGRKGGSSVAAAICNALLYIAAGMPDPGRR